MKKIYILFILSLCDPFAFGQQSAMLEKYRSMALEYSHDLKAAEKNLAASIELEKSARADLKPKLSGDANFQYTGNPLEINLNLPGMDNPLQIQGRDTKYGASLTLLQPIYTGGRFRSLFSDGYSILEYRRPPGNCGYRRRLPEFDSCADSNNP